MYTETYFFIFVVFDLKFINRVKGHQIEKFKRFSSDTDFYFQNATTTTKLPNVIKDNPANMVRWKTIDMNKTWSATTTLDKTRRKDKTYFYKKNAQIAHRFKPLLSDNLIKSSPLIKEYGKDVDMKLEDYNELKFESPTTKPSITKPATETTHQTRTHAQVLSNGTIPLWHLNDLSTKMLIPDRVTTADISKDVVRLSRARQIQLRENMCERFVPSKLPFDYNQMENVWQTMYYRIADNIQCFQILIKIIHPEQKESYQRKYGNFSGAVDWPNVHLEISATTNIGRKHFLQGSNENMGILENIIISRDVETGDLVIHEESPDQWLVVSHLLLMRDCESGGIVVFSKVPYVPRRAEIENALAKFNERYGTGKLTCDEDEVINKSFEVEEDVQSFWNN